VLDSGAVTRRLRSIPRGAAALGLVCLCAAACSHDWDGAYDEQFAGTGGTGGRTPAGGSAGSSAGAAGSPQGGAGGVAAAAGQVGEGGVAGQAGASAAGAAGNGGIAGHAGTGSAGAPGCVGNLVVNGGFEDVRGNTIQSWVEYDPQTGQAGTWRSSSTVAFEGSRSLVFDTRPAAAGDAGEYALAVTTETPFGVTPGEALTLYAAVRIDEAAVGQIPPTARFVYHDAGGVYLPALDGPPHDLPSGTQFASLGPITETVPAGAVQAGLVITVRRLTLTYVDAVCVSR
jgi:hypothetical protein